MAARVLVVTPVSLEPRELERQVRAHAGDDAVTQVVVPAVKLSRLEWLASDEDAARAEAGEIAAATEARTSGQTRAAVGDTDPTQAVEDALRTFPADEIVIVTRADAEADWLEGGAVAESLERFDLPVVHLVASESGDVVPPEEGTRALTESHEVARGADEATPARLLGRVGTIVLGAAVVVIVLVLVIYWLA
jgi:hypothetical protein